MTFWSRFAIHRLMNTTHKTTKQMAVTTSRGLGRYAARITIGGEVAMVNAARKAKQVYPELRDADFFRGWKAERKDLAVVR